MQTGILHLALTASLHAGKAILEIYSSSDFGVELKSDNSPLTLADRKSHEIITQHLAQTGFPVLSEEGKEIPYEIRKDWDSYWIVDPLDGTKEFISRNGEFTINIALAHRTEPVMGVIYSPVRQMIYYAVPNEGSFKIPLPETEDLTEIPIEKLMALAARLPLPGRKRRFTAVGSRSHMNEQTLAYIRQLKAEHGEVELISSGSALKFCQVAEGLADVYPRFAPTYEWDTAAGQAIVEMAGGKVVVADTGDRLLYNKASLVNPGFIATGHKLQASSLKPFKSL
jgi:3'(2'), 5'-bisphosphate nucleotidase